MLRPGIAQPLCGWPWLQKHRQDYSQSYIDHQTITIIKEGSTLKVPNIKDSKGIIRGMVKGDK